MRALIKRIFTKGTFASNVATLGSGTALGQLSVILAAPILSRLFTPADFGDLQFIVSSALILATFSTLRYEMSIPLPKEDRDAFLLVKLALGLAGVLTLLITGLITGAHLSGYSAGWWQKYARLAYFIPVLLMIEAGNATLGYWFMRQNNYRRPSTAKAAAGRQVGNCPTHHITGAYAAANVVRFVGNGIGNDKVGGRQSAAVGNSKGVGEQSACGNGKRRLFGNA